jgi:hypothetical protein
MTPGETTLLKIVADESDMEAARQRFHVAFPPQRLSDVAFDAVVSNLNSQGQLRRDRQGTRLLLTEMGQETLIALQRAEEASLRESL